MKERREFLIVLNETDTIHQIIDVYVKDGVSKTILLGDEEHDKEYIIQATIPLKLAYLDEDEKVCFVHKIVEINESFTVNAAYPGVNFESMSIKHELFNDRTVRVSIYYDLVESDKEQKDTGPDIKYPAYSNKHTIFYKDEDVIQKLTEALYNAIENVPNYMSREIVILAIGSDRYSGDALGPLVGEYLCKNTDDINITVYGTLEEPVHAGNLKDVLSDIYPFWDEEDNFDSEEYLIIAVDACLGKKEEVGNIEVWTGGMLPGMGVGNKLPQVGDVTIIGVVNEGGGLGFLDLQSTPLSLVIRQSEYIAAALEQLLREMCTVQDDVDNIEWS